MPDITLELQSIDAWQIIIFHPAESMKLRCSVANFMHVQRGHTSE